uniref:WW domain-containing oxidoreductase n=1 Tax=Strigamia maritima TaxID=126957 RepID=T1JHK1_STRMM
MELVGPDSDSEDELPGGWEERATLDGRVYYANHMSKSTQWTHPRTELPYGWERCVKEDGQIFYVDHVNQKTTYSDPRLAFAVEEKDSPTDIRQRFDASTAALQILHGQDWSGRNVVVTGANSGIGLETAKSLAFHGATVILGSRNMEKSFEAIENFATEKPQIKAEAMLLDLCSFRSIHQFATDFQKKYPKLDLLVLNAAVFGVPYSRTENGFESTFQTNYLGHFYLVKLLEDTLIKSAPNRVVVVASESHRFAKLSSDDISLEKLSPPACQYSGLSAYNLSKLCNILFATELNARLYNKGIFTNSLHPGNMQQAAATTIYCAAAPELEQVGGLYFNNCCRCEPSATAQDKKLAKELWDLSEQMIKDSLTKGGGMF